MTTALVVLCAAGIDAQGPATARFEVASIKANRTDAPMQLLPTLQPSGRVFAVNLPLRELIRAAYALQDNQIIMESKLADARFDLEARAPENATPAQAGLMLRAVLTERFGLKAHPETRQLPVYTLMRTDSTRLGPQMKRSGTECAPLVFPSGPGAPPPPPPPPPSMSGTPLGETRTWARCPTMFFPGGVSARAMDMAAFAMALERILRRPVIDKTGLNDQFDFDLTYTPEYLDGVFAGGVASPQRDGVSLFTALREQLGLRLESGRAAVNVLVIDDVKQPAEN